LRKALPFLVVGFLVLSGLGAVATLNDDSNFEQISISFDQPIVKNEEPYLAISIDEANTYLMNQGKPMIPSYEQSFKYPFGTKIKSVTITPKNIQDLKLTKKISPTPKMVQVGQKIEINSNIIDYGDEPYPENWYVYKVFSGIDGKERKTIVKIEIFPIKYYPNENKILWASSFDINIAYETPIAPLNYEADYAFVIITPSGFSSQLNALVNHKINRGVTTKLVTITEIKSGTHFPVTGRDDQEKIKYFIKNAIENWATSNVLLVGGVTEFPARLTHVYIEDDPLYGDEIFVSDLYYADIYDGEGNFSSWDSNDNDIFGEYNWENNYDEVDLHPDVNLGRWAAYSSGQVTACVNKDIAYETSVAYQQSWFTNLVLCGGDSFEDDDGVDEGEYINQKVIDIMSGFIPNKLWASNGKLSSIAPSGAQNINNAINDGCGFVDFSGHGNTNIWASHPHNQSNIWLPTPWPPGGYYTSNVLNLNGGSKNPIITVEACSTAKFNVDDNCLNWAFVYNANGGAIGTFGATGLGYGYIGTAVSQGLIGKMGLDTFKAYKISGAQTYGEMWSKSLDRYIKTSMNDGDYKTVEEWQPFGDPTIEIAAQSNPPAKPSRPYGPNSGNTGASYTFSTSATDPDSDKVYYMFDWGDGTSSGWIGPFNSGATGQASKTWKKTGTYTIKAVAKDTHGKMSVWSDPFSISIPRSRTRFTDAVQGTFYAEMGITGDPEPTINLNGQFRVRARYTVFGGIATYENHEGRFRGIFFNNFFAIKAPIGQRTITIFGRCNFDENHETFTGQWRTRSNILNGWINGELNPV
jgi:hypothetical protein